MFSGNPHPECWAPDLEGNGGKFRLKKARLRQAIQNRQKRPGSAKKSLYGTLVPRSFYQKLWLETLFLRIPSVGLHSDCTFFWLSEGLQNLQVLSEIVSSHPLLNTIILRLDSLGISFGRFLETRVSHDGRRQK